MSFILKFVFEDILMKVLFLQMESGGFGERLFLFQPKAASLKDLSL